MPYIPPSIPSLAPNLTSDSIFNFTNLQPISVSMRSMEILGITGFVPIIFTLILSWAVTREIKSFKLILLPMTIVMDIMFRSLIFDSGAPWAVSIIMYVVAALLFASEIVTTEIGGTIFETVRSGWNNSLAGVKLDQKLSSMSAVRRMKLDLKQREKHGESSLISFDQANKQYGLNASEYSGYLSTDSSKALTSQNVHERQVSSNMSELSARKMAMEQIQSKIDMDRFAQKQAVDAQAFTLSKMRTRSELQGFNQKQQLDKQNMLLQSKRNKYTLNNWDNDRKLDNLNRKVGLENSRFKLGNVGKEQTVALSNLNYAIKNLKHRNDTYRMQNYVDKESLITKVKEAAKSAAGRKRDQRYRKQLWKEKGNKELEREIRLKNMGF